MSDPHVLVRTKGMVREICLNRPMQQNILHFSTLERLAELAAKLQDEPQIRVVIFCAKGKHFSFGADLNEIRQLRTMDQKSDEFNAHLVQGGKLLQAISAIPQVSICAMQGMVMGGGAAIASACDFRIAQTDMKLAYGEVKLGVNLMWGALPLLVQVVGAAPARKLVMSGTIEPAEQLLQWQFLDALVKNGKLMEQARQMAYEYAALPPLAVQSIKARINRCLQDRLQDELQLEEQEFAKLLRSSDCEEALQAMQEKRQAIFTGASQDAQRTRDKP